MSNKLVQKHLLYGTQEFEIRDDVIKAKFKHPLKGQKERDIVLAILNPEPEITGSRLHFHSRVKCGPLMSLYLNKPTPEAFNRFVETVKQQAKKEYSAYSGMDK